MRANVRWFREQKFVAKFAEKKALGEILLSELGTPLNHEKIPGLQDKKKLW